MKKIILAIAIMSLFSCKGKFIDGKITDTIGMERTEIVFGPKNDTVTFKTQKNYYYLTSYTNRDQTYINSSYTTMNDTCFLTG